MPLLSSLYLSTERASVFSFSSSLLAALRRAQHCMNTTAARTCVYARLANHPRTLAWSNTAARSATSWGGRVEISVFKLFTIGPSSKQISTAISKKELLKKSKQVEVVFFKYLLKQLMRWLRLWLNADQSVSAACQCAPGEGLDGDGGLSDHEEQLSDHHHAEGLLDY